MQRRDFMRTLALAAPTLRFGQLYAASADSPRLLVVFLRGGYDCLNVLVPYASADYYELRPNILRQQVSAAMADEMQQANRDAITAKGFELEAQRIGRLLRTDYAIGFVDIGGWDTHVNQNATLAANLDSLGRGLQALSRELGNAWSSTAVVVISEFGRTFRENGNRGTDHGHGSVYWIAGGAIAGGRIVGRQQRIERATLFQDRDLPVLNDYRAVIGGLVQSMWDLSASQMEQVFPAVATQDLGLV